jgi:hypothetical protein
MRGFSSLSSGAFRLIDMLASLRWTPAGADWNACSLHLPLASSEGL